MPRPRRTGKMGGIVNRVAAAVLLLALLGVAAVSAFSWAREPLDLNRFLLDAPIDLKAGAKAGGSFTPQRDGAFELSIRIRRDPSSAHAQWRSVIASAWHGADPVGFSVSYTIRSDGTPVKSGVIEASSPSLIEGDSRTVVLVPIPDGRVKPYEAEIRVERARKELAGLSSSFVVEDQRYRTSYVRVVAAVRHGVVLLALLLVLGVVVMRRGEEVADEKFVLGRVHL